MPYNKVEQRFVSEDGIINQYLMSRDAVKPKLSNKVDNRDYE